MSSKHTTKQCPTCVGTGLVARPVATFAENRPCSYPHSVATYKVHADYHEEQAAKHYKNAQLQSAHTQASKRHVVAAKTLRTPEGRKKSHQAYRFAGINRLGSG